MQAQCDIAEAKNRELLERNRVLHSSLFPLYGVEGHVEAAEEATESSYVSYLAQVHAIREEIEQAKNASMEELNATLKERLARLEDIKNQFAQVRQGVLKDAESFRSHQSIPARVVTEVEEKLLEKSAEVEDARKVMLTLKRRLATLQSLIKARERLADNLTVMDYEQLKIENQASKDSLNKTEQDLSDATAKFAELVHLNAHYSARLQIFGNDKVKLELTLKGLKEEHTVQRDLLFSTKKERDGFRVAAGRAKKSSEISKNKVLVSDFEKNKDILKNLELQAHALKMTLQL